MPIIVKGVEELRCSHTAVRNEEWDANLFDPQFGRYWLKPLRVHRNIQLAQRCSCDFDN